MDFDLNQADIETGFSFDLGWKEEFSFKNNFLLICSGWHLVI